MWTINQIMADKVGAIKEKKEESKLKTSDSLGYEAFDKLDADKMGGISYSPKTGELLVKVVANTAMYVDSDADVILRGAYDKTCAENGKNIKFLHDHVGKTTAQIGTTLKVVPEEVSTAALGVETNITTAQVLMHYAVVKESYNKAVYEMYKSGDINQHSVGLRYIQIDIATNDKKYQKEFETWEKYYTLLLNPKMADEYGMFWVVKECAVRENSAVLWGSNKATPVIDVEIPLESPVGAPPKSKVVETPRQKSIADFLYNK